MLWDGGVVYVDSASSIIRRNDVQRARKAVELDDEREQRTVAHWLARTGTTREEFSVRLAGEGINLAGNARNLPKGALKRVRTMFGDTRPLHPPPDADVPDAMRADLEPFRWDIVGNAEPAGYLTEEELLAIDDVLAEDAAGTSDPIEPPGVRDRNLLSSAVNRPRTSLGGQLKYSTVEMAAAALFHSVILNHAFHNGNKRTGLVSMVAFLDANKMTLTCDQSELFKITLRTAAHGLVPPGADNLADREVMELARWIRSNSRLVDRQERPMKWLKLRRRLRDFHCECEPVHGVGNRMNITRRVLQYGRIRRKAVTLATQVAWAGDGTEADKNTIHKIRNDLHLDEEHGVDGRVFYEGAEIDAVVIEYRNILRRLAKL